MTLDRFYPIFDSADWLRRMLPLGVKLVQLRIKLAPDTCDDVTGGVPQNARANPISETFDEASHQPNPQKTAVQRCLPKDALETEIATARDLCRAHGATLIVNDFWELAIELGCDFVHLGQEDLDTADLPAIRRAGLRLGVSTHDHAELDRALSVSPDYVALGPVWPTILKKMPWAPQGLERVAEWKRAVGATPLCAIGGMTPDRGRAALAAGADLVSVVTDITLNDTPETRVQEWLAATR